MSPLLYGVLVWVLLQFAIGAYVSRRVATEDDYFVAGRKLGPILATATIFATWFGAETCLGAAGQVYANGLSLTQAEPFAYGACLILSGLFFALPLWRRKLITLADLFAQRFGNGVAKLAAVLMIPTSLFWAAAQVRGFGAVLAETGGLDPQIGIAIAAIVVISYTAFGGMLADVWTDLIQGIALVAGLVAVGVAVAMREGGADAALQAGAAARGASASADLFGIGLCEEWAIPILGSVVAQELVARMSAARSGSIAQGATMVGGLLYLAVGCIPVFLGLVGAGLVPELADPEGVLPALAKQELPPWLYIVFAGALVSAILSTVDSNLLVCSSLLSHNLVFPLLERHQGHLSERHKVRYARLGVAVFGTAAWLLAVNADGVFALVEQASAFGSSGIFIAVVFGLYTRFGGAHSAVFALVSGTLVYVYGTWAEWETPYLASLAAAFAGYVVLALVWPYGHIGPTTPAEPTQP